MWDIHISPVFCLRFHSFTFSLFLLSAKMWETKKDFAYTVQIKINPWQSACSVLFCKSYWKRMLNIGKTKHERVSALGLPREAGVPPGEHPGSGKPQVQCWSRRSVLNQKKHGPIFESLPQFPAAGSCL